MDINLLLPFMIKYSYKLNNPKLNTNYLSGLDTL